MHGMLTHGMLTHLHTLAFTHVHTHSTCACTHAHLHTHAWHAHASHSQMLPSEGLAPGPLVGLAPGLRTRWDWCPAHLWDWRPAQQGSDARPERDWRPALAAHMHALHSTHCTARTHALHTHVMHAYMHTHTHTHTRAYKLLCTYKLLFCAVFCIEAVGFTVIQAANVVGASKFGGAVNSGTQCRLGV